MPDVAKGHPASMVMVRVGNQDYPARNLPQCRVCQSPHRLFIERMLLSGSSYMNILRTLEQGDYEPGPMGHPGNRGIATHAQHHIPIAAATQHALIRRRAREIGKDIETAVENVVDYVTAAQLVVQRGVENITSGEMKVGASDMIAAVRALHAIDATNQGGLDAEVSRDALITYMELMIEMLSEHAPHLIAEYSQRCSTSPILQALTDKMMKGPVIDAEIMPDDAA